MKLEHAAITNQERLPRTENPLVRCAQCHKPLALISGDKVIIRLKGREYLSALPMRITCDCGHTTRLA
jgi:RNase P subunit RPR2